MSLVDKYFPKELYEILKSLDGKREEITTMEVSRVAGVSHSFLVNILPSLKNEGFVSIERGIDKRVKLVKLMEGGRYLLHALKCYREALEGNYALIKALMKS